MANELIKFLYITEKFDIFSFVDKLIDRLDLYDEVAYQSISSLQVYRDNTHKNRFSLRMEVSGRMISNKLRQYAEQQPDKPFPRIRVDDEMVIFIPANISKEQMIVCELKEGSHAYGSVLRVKDDDFTSMFKFMNCIKNDFKTFDIISIVKLSQDFLVSFSSFAKAQEAMKKFKSKRIRVKEADICLAASSLKEPTPVIAPKQQKSVVFVDIPENKTSECVEDELKMLRKEVQTMKLEIQDLKEEVFMLKESKKEGREREIVHGGNSGEIRVTKTFNTPNNQYMTFVPIQPSTSKGLLGYFYDSEEFVPAKKVKID